MGRDQGSARTEGILTPRRAIREKERRNAEISARERVLSDLDSQFINTYKSVTLRSSLINLQSVVSKLDMSASLTAIETH